MKPVVVLDSKKDVVLEMEIHGNQKYGSFTEVRTPYKERLRKFNDKTEYYGYNDEDYVRNVSFDVENKVYSITEYTGGALEHSETEYYTNKSCNFTKEEMNFLPNMSGRYIYCVDVENRYLLDNQENEMYYLKEDEIINNKKDFIKIVNKAF